MAAPTPSALSGGPDDVAIIRASRQVAAAPALDPVRDPQDKYVTDIETKYRVDPARQFVGAATPPGASQSTDPASVKLSVPLDLGGEQEVASFAARDVGNILVGLYMVGGWQRVADFQKSLGKVLYADASGRSSAGPNAPVKQAFVKEMSLGLEKLNALIADVLVQFAERAQVLAQQRAIKAKPELLKADKRYAIRRMATEPAPGGTEGGPGDTPKYEAAAEGEPGAAASLIADVKAAVSAYTAYRAAIAVDLIRNGGVPAETPPPAVTAARTRFLSALRDASGRHTIGAGVIAICLPKDESGSPATVEDQTIYEAIVAYLEAANEALGAVSAQYPSDLLRNSLKVSLVMATAPLGLHIDDTPEARAAVFAGYTRQRTPVEALRADSLLHLVRSNIVETATVSRDTDELLRARFACAVLTSYLEVTDVRYAIQAAQLKQAEAPLSRIDVTAAVLDLIGFLVPPVGLVGAALSLYSLYGHVVNQFQEIALSATVLDGQAIDALFVDDSASFAKAIADKPRGLDVIADVVVSLASMHGVSKILPAAGLALQAAMDCQTLVEAATASGAE